MPKLSIRQVSILDFIRSFLIENGYPPTVRDIQHGCEISSTSVVDYNLHILRREGYIRRSPDVSRGIELLDSSDDKISNWNSGQNGAFSSVPVFGYIAAGEPIPVPSTETWNNEEPIDRLDLPASLSLGRSDLYALRVRGRSMIDALIDDGDSVVLQPVQQVRSGDMVVAWLKLEKEATLKYFYHEGQRIRLQPANEQMDPIYVEPENLEIQGRVVAVIRQLA